MFNGGLVKQSNLLFKLNNFLTFNLNTSLVYHRAFRDGIRRRDGGCVFSGDINHLVKGNISGRPHLGFRARRLLRVSVAGFDRNLGCFPRNDR